jgi:hypothetical protein
MWLLITMANPLPSSSSSSDDDTAKLSWTNLIDESVHTSDDMDIGDIDAVNRDFVVVKRGFVNLHYYYIPITKVEGWDGHILWLKITENEVKANYERDKIPDPSQYYVKDYPTYDTDYYPELVVIQPPRYVQPIFNTPPPPYSPDTGKAPKTYECILCNMAFKTEDKLSMHISSQH